MDIEFADLCLNVDSAQSPETRRAAMLALLNWILDNQDSIYDALTNRELYNLENEEDTHDDKQ